MGKQKGDGGRTKNRPSSSSLAASLLPSGATSIGFGGYLGSARIDSPSSSSAAAEESTSSFLDVDSELAQHLKKLGRKDPTTKLKALSSLCLLLKEKSGEDVMLIVPQWAFEYKRLLLDYNREVRRATHDTMTSLVMAVRKGLAPHLKSLMGPWWFSQFDPIPEVSQAAKKSFEAAFPSPERRKDSLMLCANEIFLYLDENLKLTPQSMSDKATPMDELEDMHQRVISSSLLAVATLLDILLAIRLRSNDSENVTSEQKLASKARIATICSAEKMFSMHKFFLEFVKSKSSVVRSATYSVLVSFIKHIPNALEGNMKTVSAAILGVFQEKDASCHSSMWDLVLLFSRQFPEAWSYKSIQQVALSRFWNFLKHGCYGSKQISYPALVVFLESIPPNAVEGEEFIFKFFQNLWAGRSPFHSSAEDNLVFFKAFKECLLWALYKASRCSTGEDSFNSLSVRLINDILVSLLWQDYLPLHNSKNRIENIIERSDGSAEEARQLLNERSKETLSASYPLCYVQELGRCIVELLSDISNKQFSLLSAFFTSFKEDCLEMFQKGDHLSKFHEHAERIASFFRLLDQHAVQKGQAWPLHSLAGPMLADSFTVIKSIDSPDAVRIVSILVEIFRPVTLFSYLHGCKKDQFTAGCVGDYINEAKTNYFLQMFTDEFVPWCLCGHSRSISAKLDLLIALVEDEYFSEQWSVIITHATNLLKCSETDLRAPDIIDQVQVLAMLIEKVREEISSMKLEGMPNARSSPYGWQHKLLDSAAVSVALHSSSVSHVRFLSAVLGGSFEDDNTCFLAKETVISIYDGILKNLVSFVMASPFEWARFSSSLVLSSGSKELMQIHESSFVDRLKMAQFSFDVLEGTIFCLTLLGDVCLLFPSILAVVFIIDWECSMASHLSENDSLESCKQEQFTAKMTFGRRIHAFLSKMSASFQRCLSPSNLSRLRTILVQAVRSSAFETNSLCADIISSLCCTWVLDILEFICHDQTELQSMLDQLLSEDDSWPLWVAPKFQDGSRSAAIQDKKGHICINEMRHLQFVAFVDKLISNLGVSKVVAGFVPEMPAASASTKHIPTYPSLYSRAWLASELLCTWKWPGGCALDSLLPSLSKYAESEVSNPEVNVTHSIVNILFSGSISQEVCIQWVSIDAWILSDNEIENVQDAFLRALISLLLSLFVKDKIWRKQEALMIFEQIFDRLSIPATTNRTCLRILPFVLSVIIKPLLAQSTEFDGAGKDILLAPWKDDLVLKNITSWLEKALSFPPLCNGWTEEQDPEEWLQVVISCYPLCAMVEPGTCKVEVLRDIGHLEKSLLLSLFRKQRCVDSSPDPHGMMFASSSNGVLVTSARAHMILAKLIAVSIGYCWQEFSIDDWNFVFDNFNKWVESSVLSMEEMVENIDDVVKNYTSNVELVEEKLEQAVQALDPTQISTSNGGLFILRLCSQLLELHEAGDFEVLQFIKLERWDEIYGRAMENILRLFFASGVAQAIASSCSEEASSLVASSRVQYSQFWGRIASFVISSPLHVRNTALKSMELWGLSKGPISSLYAILFCSKPISSVQYAAYRLLSTEPICYMSLLKENYLGGDTITSQESELLDKFGSSSEGSFCLLDEISCLILKPSSKLLEMDAVSQYRVNVYVAWAILLAHLDLLPPSSSKRERLIHYVQESDSSTILDCIFQNIPLKTGTSNPKKKDVELVAEASKAAKAAKHIIVTRSVLLSIEALCPVGTDQMAILAGSVYGMMVRLLPSYVGNWFTSLRDRSLSAAIESFTKVWCSPSLVSDELSQVKEIVICDENFSLVVNKSAYEIVATYKKEETGMDLVIRLPSCYPLRSVDVDCLRSLGISEVKKRKWLLSMTAFVRNRNGAVGEAIRIWKSNIDKEFLGVEECPICYSIIHTSYQSLPRLACKTCKHKFHKACLYKWFSTSHKSTCPLCQTPF